jgi:hypothetical protein
MFEVQNQCCFETCDGEVAEHLGEVTVVESGDDFGIDDDGFVDDEVRDERADVLFLVVNGKLFLGIAAAALLGEFDDESPLVELFIETGFERPKDLVSGSDNEFGKFVGVHDLQPQNARNAQNGGEF